MIDFNLDKPAAKHNQKLRWKSSAFCFVAFVIVIVLFGGKNKKVETPLKKCHGIAPPIREVKMREYFKKSGNKHPELMAQAVLATKKPKLLAAVAVKGELNTPYTVRKGGYQKKHVGAFQVNESIHGFAGTTPLQQALKAEQILDELIAESGGNLHKALNAYGGDRTRKVYARTVLAELENIP